MLEWNAAPQIEFAPAKNENARPQALSELLSNNASLLQKQPPVFSQQVALTPPHSHAQQLAGFCITH